MTWARFEDRFPWHRKIRPLTDAAFRLHVSAVCWCNEHLTDGVVLADELPLASDVKKPAVAVAELVRRGVWESTNDGWQIHDYLAYNFSREQASANRESKVEAGRKGGIRSGQTRSKREANAQAKPKQLLPENAKQNEARPDPTQPEPIRPIQTQPRSAAVAVAPTGNNSRLAQQLAKSYTDRVPLSKFPAVQQIAKKALDAGYDPPRIESALLRLAADGRAVTIDGLRIELDGPARQRPKESTTDQRVGAALALAEELRREAL